jgi:hypothetical protein
MRFESVSWLSRTLRRFFRDDKIEGGVGNAMQFDHKKPSLKNE